jgi:hypothetical protein
LRTGVQVGLGRPRRALVASYPQIAGAKRAEADVTVRPSLSLPSVLQRLGHQCLDQAAVVRTDGTRCLRHVDNGELFLGIDPEKCSAGAGSHVLAFGTMHAGEPRPLPNHEAEAECISIHSHQQGARSDR